MDGWRDGECCYFDWCTRSQLFSFRNIPINQTRPEIVVATKVFWIDEWVTGWLTGLAGLWVGQHAGSHTVRHINHSSGVWEEIFFCFSNWVKLIFSLYFKSSFQASYHLLIQPVNEKEKERHCMLLTGSHQHLLLDGSLFRHFSFLLSNWNLISRKKGEEKEDLWSNSGPLPHFEKRDD